MDNGTATNGGDSDLSESWTLIDKETIEQDDGIPSEEITTGNSSTEILPEAAKETRDTCELCESVDSPDLLPPDSTVKSPNEGAESIDSDGISIISESEEEEELHLLPCNPPQQDREELSGSRSSNKYFDETDTSSQCSSKSHDLLGTESEKKYVHQPNSALNTSLNILLAIACAAVLGLGMGHFMGLQEECPAGSAVDDNVVNTSQNEELSALLLKKLELENNALKEQFANLQSVIEEIRRNNSISPCHNKYLHDKNAETLDRKEEEKVLNTMMGAKCEVAQELPAKHGVEGGMPKQRKKDSSRERANTRDDTYERTSSGGFPTPPDETTNGKDETFPKLEKSLEDLASLFHSTLNGEKSLPESSQEALSVAFTVFSSLMDNVQEKLNGLKKNMDEGTLNFDVPMKAISKMEDVIQKTSQKIQKVAKDALKEGQPLYTISNGITSKLRTINKKLENKWCQIKKNLSKQSPVLGWLDEQLFHNCSDEDGEDDGTNEDAGLNGFPGSMDDIRVENSDLWTKKRKFDQNDAMNDKYINLNSKKVKTSSSDEESYKIKERALKNEYKPENLREKYKYREYKDPNAFDFDYNPKKGRNKENRYPKMENKRRKEMDVKNGGARENGRYSAKQYELANSGEWVEAMFNSRAERRRDERRSDWVFARARSRTKSRDIQPSRWYFRKGEEK
ncbi:TNF receptor-associated factor family protein DDB_G0272098-like [Hetaerina americana]|uniref:TNF receptor-associated factor family protein DDB_G0272098-like n=1 Tax=Hetaerina americana TaxID=62018 RepID=UPI003A7F39EE